MAKERVTMKDIAEACGVSRMTVSLALKGKQERMKPETYERILEAANRLSYTKDPRISQLTSYLVEQRQGKSVKGELAYLMPLNPDFENDSRNLYFYDIVSEVADYYGYRVEIYEWSGLPGYGYTEKQIERMWDARGVRGAFVGPLQRGVAPKMNWDKYAWVKFGEQQQCPPIHSIDSDFRMATMLCCEELHRRGYRRIGLIALAGYDRLMQYSIRNGFDAFHAKTRNATRLAIFDDDLGLDLEVLHRSLRKWLARVKPDVVVTDEHWLPRFEGIGLKVPEDMPLATWLIEPKNPLGMSGIRRADSALAKTSVELLVSQINHGFMGVPEVPIRTRVSGYWQDGKTVPTR